MEKSRGFHFTRGLRTHRYHCVALRAFMESKPYQPSQPLKLYKPSQPSQPSQSSQPLNLYKPSQPSQPFLNSFFIPNAGFPVVL